MRRLCHEEGIQLEELSQGWVLRLRYQGKVRHIFANTFDTDRAATQKIVADKVATAAVLEQLAIPHVAHKLFYGFQRAQPSESIWQPILAYAAAHRGQVVAKALRSSGGKDVYICLQPKALEQACQLLFQSEPAISLSPYYPAQSEYRLMMFQGQCHILYEKKKPSLLGDGRRSIAGLLEQKAKAETDPQRATMLRALLPEDSSRILAQNELYLLSHKHNLSKGAEVNFAIEASVKEKLLALAKRTVDGLGLVFGSVDILQTGQDAENDADKQDGLKVLEVNSGVMVDNLLKLQPELSEKVDTMYRTVLRSLFANLA